jgi:iron complex outermembrane recepter protein
MTNSSASLRRLVFTTCSMAAAAVAGPAYAENAPTAAASGTLDEIVVTAQRREERLQDVPISVSVYSQALMDAQGVRTVDDISRLTPGLSFVRGAVNNNSDSSDIAIRGIDSTAGAATTGIYIDDTPIQSRHLSFGTFNAYPALFDVERVEVLRGPQGTLFGSGSEGGTVRFITPEPDLKKYSAYVRSEFAATQHGDPVYELGAAGGGPVVDDKLGFRASASVRHEGGYIDRVDWHTGNVVDHNANSNRTTTARLAFKWAATDDLAITPAVYYQERKIDDTSAYWSTIPGLGNPTGTQFESPFKTGNAIASPSTDKFTLTSLKIDWNLGAVRLQSSTSYYDRNQSATSDYTQYDRAVFLGNPYAAPGVQAPTAWADTQKNFTQEIRLESTNPADRITWTAGVFFQNAKENTIERVYDPAILTQLSLPVGDGYIYDQNPFSSVDKQIALFGQADIKITDKLKGTLGLRYSKADFTGEAAYTGFVVGPPVSSSVSQTERPVTPKIGLSYQIDQDNLLYAAAAKGFRIGGTNPDIGVFCDLSPYGLSKVPPAYASDSLWSYEVGSKNAFDGRRLLVDASAYLIKWKNIQQNVALPCGFQFTGNLGNAESKGFDIQTQWRVTDALSVGLNFGYTDAAYTETVCATAGACKPNPPASFSIVQDGDHLPGSPWTLGTYAQLNFPLMEHRGYARLDYQYGAKQTDVVAAQNPLNGGDPKAVPSVPSQSNAALRAGIKFGGFDVSVFSQNLFDSKPRLGQYVDGPNGTPLFQVITYRPRTIGVTAMYRY